MIDHTAFDSIRHNPTVLRAWMDVKGIKHAHLNDQAVIDSVHDSLCENETHVDIHTATCDICFEETVDNLPWSVGLAALTEPEYHE